MYYTVSGDCQSASTSISSACRLVCELGGQFGPSTTSASSFRAQQSERSSRHTRSLFWLCYTLDKETSLRTGHPPCLTQDYCDLSLTEDLDKLHGHDSMLLPATGPQLPGDPHLGMIQERSCRTLFSPRAHLYSDSELLHHIRQLDEELESWRLSITPPFRPRLHIPADGGGGGGGGSLIPPGMTTSQRVRLISLQLNYLHTLTTIHTTIRRCGDFDSDLPDDLHSVVHSSTDMSLEASRSTLRFLRAAIELWEEESVW